MIEPQKDTEGTGIEQLSSVPAPLDRIGKLVFTICSFLRPCFSFVSVFAVLLFIGALFWAKAQDPFSRKWVALKTADHGALNCVVVLPKPIRPCPVVVYAHGVGGSLMSDGFELRQMAEFDLALVSLEYNQTDASAFPAEMEAVLRYLDRQKWADTNAIAWLGFSLGANRILDFAWHHPEQQPQLLIQLSGGGLGPSILSHPPSHSAAEEGQFATNLNCALLLIHGDQDEIFPVADSKEFAAEWQSNGLSVELRILPGLLHGMEAERGVIFRCIGEYCLSRLSNIGRGSNRSEETPTDKGESRKEKAEMGVLTSAATSGEDVWQSYHSIAQRQAQVPSLVWFWLPAATWAIGLFFWRHKHGLVLSKRRKLYRSEIALRWLAAVLAIWALAETGLHLITPHCLVSNRTLSIARRIFVPEKEHADFEALACQPFWKGEKLRALLDHVELAGYNRELIDWQLDDTMYRDQVLSPAITGEAVEQLNWRRPLWKEFYPRIRHESSPEDAARIVVRHLRERVTVLAMPNLPHAVPDIWLRQLTDRTGFEIIYVAALRSVGVPARLDAKGRAEIFAGRIWQSAPRPVIYDAF